MEVKDWLPPGKDGDIGQEETGTASGQKPGTDFPMPFPDDDEDDDGDEDG